LVGNPERKGPQGRPKRRWEGSIKVDFGEEGWDDMDWIDLVPEMDQLRALVNTVRLGNS
jgi:hypothetical protein